MESKYAAAVNPMLTLILSKEGRYKGIVNLRLSFPLSLDPNLAVENGQELAKGLCASRVDILFGCEELEGLLQLLIGSGEFRM
jgi:hypothetical protein